MQYRNRRALFVFSIVALLSLISCAEKPNMIELSTPLSNTPSPGNTSSSENATTTYTPTPTAISSTIILAPTEMPLSGFDGRVLFAGVGMNERLNYFGINMLSLKDNGVVSVVERNLEMDGRQITLDYPVMAWSPDGHQFAFVGTDKESSYYDVYVSKADGTELFRLTHIPNYKKYSLSWSPDGQYILVAMGLDNTSDLYLANSKDGEIVKRLTFSGGYYYYDAVWSPDGEKIAFGSDLEFTILNISTEVKETVDLLSEKLRISDMSWSPNGDQIAFSAYPYYPGEERCRGDIFIAYINTGVIVNLTDSIYDEVSPSWSPDGKHIAFSRSVYPCSGGIKDGPWEVFVTNASREEQKIILNAGNRPFVAWAPVPNLQIGDQYTITELGAFLNLRTEPSLNGKILTKLPAGEVVTILEGFVDADDYYWWKIQAQDGTEGWAVEVANWYQPLNE